METNSPTKLPPGRIRAFLKQIQQLAWLELFEKWFSLGVKLLWLTLFVAFCVFLRKEYKKDIFYIQDFKVPPAWTEQGYSGEVVKQAIIDDINHIKAAVYDNGNADGKSITGSNEDGIEFLSDFSIEGFNLKAITKSILAVFGKKNKTIGGYITLNDSTQTVAVQVTDLITQPLSVKRNEAAQKLIHKATLEIMKVKAPGLLIAYYQVKNDTVMVKTIYAYLFRHRELIKDDRFYDIAIAISLYNRQYDTALAWADSMQQKYPTDKLTFYDKAKIYGKLAYQLKTDSVTTRKNKRLFVDNLRKVKELDGTPELDAYFDILVDKALINFYYNEKDYESLKQITEKVSVKQSLDAPMNNVLAYTFMENKDFKRAEEALKRAVFLASNNGDYWDSLAELYSIQGKDSLAVVNLKIALRCSQKSPEVSVQAYQKDDRFQRLRKRNDFQLLMKRDSM